MKIEITHHIESSEPDTSGMYEWFYEYDLYRYEDEDLVLIARSYVDAPLEAHFLRFENRGTYSPVLAKDGAHPLVQAAGQHLQSCGKTNIRIGELRHVNPTMQSKQNI